MRGRYERERKNRTKIGSSILFWVFFLAIETSLRSSCEILWNRVRPYLLLPWSLEPYWELVLILESKSPCPPSLGRVKGTGILVWNSVAPNLFFKMLLFSGPRHFQNPETQPTGWFWGIRIVKTQSWGAGCALTLLKPNQVGKCWFPQSPWHKGQLRWVLSRALWIKAHGWVLNQVQRAETCQVFGPGKRVMLYLPFSVRDMAMSTSLLGPALILCFSESLWRYSPEGIY